MPDLIADSETRDGTKGSIIFAGKEQLNNRKN
jgi:hypothetical protein